MEIIVTRIEEDLYEFTESADFDGSGTMRPYVDAYLLIGKEKALLIDALQNTEDLYTSVRRITDLPVDVLITHGHLDHAGRSLPAFFEAGSRIYMDLSDYEMLEKSVPTTRREFFTELKAGDVFEADPWRLEAIPCAGHTPGCFVFLESGRQMLFSGDSLGSGMIWMQLPCCISLEEYREGVLKVWEKTRDLFDLRVFPGHRNQSPVQLTGQYVQDNLDIVNGILRGEILGKEEEMDFHGTPISYRVVEKGQMRMFCYNPGNVRKPAPMADFAVFFEAFSKREKEQKREQFRRLNRFAKKGQILFCGSSLMEQFPVQELLEDAGVNLCVYNRGIGGFTTDEMAEALPECVLDLEPKHVFINIGTNDLNDEVCDLDALMGRYEAILVRIRERVPDVKLYLLAYYPVNLEVGMQNEFMKDVLCFRNNERIRLANEKVRTLSERMGACFLDLNAGLTDEKGELKKEFTKEGMHMYGDGYREVLAALLPTLLAIGGKN